MIMMYGGSPPDGTERYDQLTNTTRTFELPSKTGQQLLERAKERLAEVEKQLAGMAALQAEADMLRRMIGAAPEPPCAHVAEAQNVPMSHREKKR